MAKYDRTELFETMPVRRAVLCQIAPTVLSQMIALIYNLADMYFVGILNDPRQTAAVTVAYSSFLMLTAISNLFGVGGASALARALGRKAPEEAREISALSFWCAFGAAVLFSVLFFLLERPILTLCGATAETIEVSLAYTRWAVVIGGPMTVMSNTMANLVRAQGDAARASFGLSMGGVLNIILDPFFVLPRFWGLGAVGAGMATSLSNLISALYFLCYILRRGGVLSLNPHYFPAARRHLRDVLSVGFPSALQYALTVVAVAAQSRFVSQYPTEAVAGLGITKKIDTLPIYFTLGVANGMLPLLAYNYASGNRKRRQEAFRFGTVIAFSFAILCFVVYQLFAPQLAGLLIADETTVAYAAAFLRRMVVAMPLMSLCYPMIIHFQAMGKVRESLICSVLRKGVLDIPLLFLMDTLIPLYGCMWVQPIVDGLSLIVVLYFHRKLKKEYT